MSFLDLVVFTVLTLQEILSPHHNLWSCIDLEKVKLKIPKQRLPKQIELKESVLLVWLMTS